MGFSMHCLQLKLRGGGTCLRGLRAQSKYPYSPPSSGSKVLPVTELPGV